MFLFCQIDLEFEYNNAVVAISKEEQPKYPKTFKNLAFLNLNAPKGGTLKLGSVGDFNKLNIFTLKGKEPIGLTLLYDQLMESTADDPNTFYALVVEKIFIAPDYEHVTLFLNKNVKFSNGIKLTAKHIRNTIEIYKNSNYSKKKSQFKIIKSIEMHSPYILTINLERKSTLDSILNILKISPLYNPDLSKQMVVPVGTGPYILKDAKKRLLLERNKNYWGVNHPLKIARNNFDEIEFEFYKDSMSLFEAFKKGEFDAYFDEDAFHFGKITIKDDRFEKISLHHDLPVPSFFVAFNVERLPDLNLRKGLSIAFDFDAMNAIYFDSKLKNPKSIFHNTRFAEQVDTSILSQKDRLKKAEQLLNEFFKNPRELIMVLNNHYFDRIVYFYKYLLSRIGLKLSVYYADQIAYQNILKLGFYDLIIVPMYNGIDPLSELKSYFKSDGCMNVFRYKDKDFDQMLNSCHKNVVQDITKIELYLLNKHLYFGLYYMDTLNVIYRKDRIDFIKNPNIFIDIIDNGWSVKS